jgi:hypothetical protein
MQQLKTTANISCNQPANSIEMSTSWDATGSLASQEIPAFCGTRRFVAILTSACHWSPSRGGGIQSTPPSHFFKNHFYIIVPLLIHAFSCWYCILQCWCWVVCCSCLYVLWIHTFIMYLMTARVSVWSPASYCAVDARIADLQGWKRVGNSDVKLWHGSPPCL